MLKRSVTVAGHTIPSWAKCYCAHRHIPTYIYPIPYEMPGGDFIYLCPNTHHGLTTFLKMCDELGCIPSERELKDWGFVVKRLGQLIWAIQKQGLTKDQYIRMETYKRLGRRLDNG